MSHKHPHHESGATDHEQPMPDPAAPQTKPPAIVDDSAGEESINLTRVSDDLYAAWLTTIQINEAAGNVCNAGWDAVQHQVKVISEEFNDELVPGANERNLLELRDGMADTMFTLVGLAGRAGIDLIADFCAVVQENLSKFDYSEEDAALTAKKYLAIGVDTYTVATELPDGRTRYVSFSFADQKDNTGKKYQKGKWLKSHAYKPVVFADLSEDNKLLSADEKLATYVAQADAQPVDAVPIKPMDASEESEVIAVSGPMEVLTQLLKTNQRFNSLLQFDLSAYARGVMGYAEKVRLPVWRTVVPAVEGLTVGETVCLAAQAGGRNFLDKLAYREDEERPGYSLEVIEQRMKALKHIHDIHDVKGIDRLVAAIRSLEPTDQVAFKRVLDTLGHQLQADPHYLSELHGDLAAAFQLEGVSWTVAQLIADTILYRFFDTNSAAAMIEEKGSNDETREVLAAHVAAIRRALHDEA